MIMIIIRLTTTTTTTTTCTPSRVPRTHSHILSLVLQRTHSIHFDLLETLGTAIENTCYSEHILSL